MQEQKEMRLMIKDQSGSRFTVYVCCDKCKKLLKQYTYSGDGGKIGRNDSDKLKEDLKKKLLKADMQYCYHCGEKNFKD